MVIDSNIIIYAVKPENKNLRFFLSDNFIICSQISILETLGYHLLSEEDKKYLEDFFQDIYAVKIDEPIIKIATELKQKNKMSVSDSIIAATALYYNFPLVTNDEEDFKNIDELQIINPFNFKS